MTEQETFTPTIIANELGIQAITLRRWCTAFAGHLSPLANPSSGNARRFTRRDRDVLKHVRSLRDQDRSLAEINEQLAGLTFPEVDTKAEIEPVQDDQPDEQVTAVASSPQGAVEPLTAYAIEQILTRVDRLERSREPAFIYGWALGAISMGILFLLIVVLASLYGGFR